LKVPDDLRNIPAILPRYPGEIPYHSLVLVAYTVSLYRAAQGSRKDQPTVPLNMLFGVVLYDKPLEFEPSEVEEDTQNRYASEQDSENAEDCLSEEVPLYQKGKGKGKEVQTTKDTDLDDEVVEDWSNDE